MASLAFEPLYMCGVRKYRIEHPVGALEEEVEAEPVVWRLRIASRQALSGPHYSLPDRRDPIDVPAAITWQQGQHAVRIEGFLDVWF